MAARTQDRYLPCRPRWNRPGDPAYWFPFISSYCHINPAQKIVSYTGNGLTRIPTHKRNILRRIKMSNESPGTITMLELQEPISGRYRLRQRWCRGGMSDVNLAYHELMQREAAIKLLNIDNTEHTQPLTRDTHLIRKFFHAHI